MLLGHIARTPTVSGAKQVEMLQPWRRTMLLESFGCFLATACQT